MRHWPSLEVRSEAVAMVSVGITDLNIYEDKFGYVVAAREDQKTNNIGVF